MTAPIQEPSTDRALQGLAYQRDQIFRRPSPASATYHNSTVKYGVLGVEWLAANQFLYTSTGVSGVFDAASVGGGYVEVNGNGKYFAIGMPLGPQGSTWEVALAYQRAPDAGQIITEWQTNTVNADLGGTVYPESVAGPDVDTTTWYVVNGADTFHIDMYSAITANTYAVVHSADTPGIHIAGDNGTALSANGTAGPADYRPCRSMNGGGDGSLMWWLRVRIVGKNAASTGYRCRIYLLSVKRTENQTGWELL